MCERLNNASLEKKNDGRVNKTNTHSQTHVSFPVERVRRASRRRVTGVRARPARTQLHKLFNALRAHVRVPFAFFVRPRECLHGARFGRGGSSRVCARNARTRNASSLQENARPGPCAAGETGDAAICRVNDAEFARTRDNYIRACTRAFRGSTHANCVFFQRG